jgi:hypothetical protein
MAQPVEIDGYEEFEKRLERETRESEAGASSFIFSADTEARVAATARRRNSDWIIGPSKLV